MSDKAFTSGGNAEQVGDCGKWSAVIDDHSHRGHWRSAWFSRISVLGETAKEAEELRDRVLNALNASSGQAWVGVGLPPVGTVCEFAGGEDCPHDPWDKDLRVGDQVTIIAHFDGGNGDQLAAFTFPTKNPNRGAFNVEQGRWGCFRPIRTPEQIAAEKYEADAADLAEVMTGHRDRSKDCYLNMAKVILDAGYRKQVAPWP